MTPAFKIQLLTMSEAVSWKASHALYSEPEQYVTHVHVCMGKGTMCFREETGG